jgi:mannose-6-phosphate isomerase-like protein (cupin superfamily)
MAIIRHSEREKKEPYPGVIRQAIVDRDSGGGALHTTYITIAPGSSVRVHRHKVEEAMMVLAGEGLAVLGDEQMPIKAHETLLAPAGVKHGFVNTGSVPMVLTTAFPTVDIEVFFDD